MSLSNATLSDFVTQEPEPEPETEPEPKPERPEWTPTGRTDSSNKQCQNCSAHVTEQFARVFGGNDDEVHGCTDCMDSSAIKRGGALEGCEGTLADGLGGSIHGGY